MPLTSKTGLLPISKKNDKTDNRGAVKLEMPKIVMPATFALKPFAGIYNPFPYGCSILCNHPAGFEAKAVVKKAKDAWSAEGKPFVDFDELSVSGVQENEAQECQSFPLNNRRDDKVPEDLFRKYTETDSRPITPTPTLASIVTKNLSRRCMTPDPNSFAPTREKTLLVLDLRRSHSQETVCWPGIGPQVIGVNFDSNDREALLRTASGLSSNPLHMRKKKSDRRKQTPSSARGSSLKTDTSKNSEFKVQTQHSSISPSPSKGSVTQEKQNSQVRDISSENSSDDANVIKRRGRKLKKGRAVKGTRGEKEFQGIPDPGETQVSALEIDSKEESSRPSSVEEKLVKNQSEEVATTRESNPERQDEKSSSFLNSDIVRRLQRQLDQEAVDSELNAKRKMALEEALRLKTTAKHAQQGEEMKNLKKEFQLVIKDSEKWLSIPRVFTRRSARFELPMDSRTLNDITPMKYVEKYVFASPERLVLYNHVFNLYKEEPDDEEKERVLLGKNILMALGKIMGRPMTADEAQNFRSFLKWKDEDCMNFRTFAGISATCERVMSHHFCSKMLSHKEDPKHEIERADFETLDEKILRLNPDDNLVRLLKYIRDL